MAITQLMNPSAVLAHHMPSSEKLLPVIAVTAIVSAFLYCSLHLFNETAQVW
jgi:hypothetical protein